MEVARKTSLIGKLVEHFSQRIEQDQLAQGSRLPSIRAAATSFEVSTFTVVQAYDRLVALGYVEARKGDGFFVARTSSAVERQRRDTPLSDVHWLLDDAFHPDASALQPGAGGLPHDWLDEPGLLRAMRSLGRANGPVSDYGEPRGNAKLRAWIQRYLDERGVPAHQEQIILTHGASQALNMVVQTLLKPGDCVLVDDPGYINLMSNLRDKSVEIVGVPWTPQGPNVTKLAELLAHHRPKAFFTNPFLHNPTGASYTPAVAHRVLQLADIYDCWIVEDDVCEQLTDDHQAPLAAMDGLQRVIHIGSFSKILASSLRVGYITAQSSVSEALLHYKMSTGLYSSQLTEHLAMQMLNDGSHRKRCERLRARLLTAQHEARIELQRLGWTCWASLAPTPYLWVGDGSEDFDPVALTRRGLSRNILLAPGRIFRPSLQATPWLRLNVSHANTPSLWRFLAESSR
ncbi:PLP-dependent aminotransferase family protein [Pseudomonas soli]|uniref:aminotransferase-like domain-containing protein n=1 Tax=Pseudomonas soli TaxID=1306993 RepID=UPI000D93C298|nr:PLP-dependent aminotransferase family protein [Pseudomonas soli]PYC44556.1 PLP-dependent aminotransferase family protein [Pseudomonas soli]